MRNFYLVAGILCLMASCTSKHGKTEDSVESHEIKTTFVTEPLKSSVFLKGCKVLSFSSDHDEALIVGVDRLLAGNDRFFVMDRKGNKLIAFDGEGRFIASTARMIGQGPDDYIRIADATIDNINQKVYAHCDAPYCILVFDMNLKLQERINLDYYMWEIANDDKYLYGMRMKEWEDLGFELLALDKADLKAAPVPLLESNNGIYGIGVKGKHLTSFSKGINVCLPFDMTICQMYHKEITADYPLDFGERQLDFSEVKDMSASQFYQSPFSDKVWSLANVYCSDSTVFFISNHIYAYLLDRNSLSCTGFSGVYNDLIPYSSTQTFPVDGSAYSYGYLWPSSYVMRFKEHLSKSESASDLKKIIEGYEEEDNPLIVLCEMK